MLNKIIFSAVCMAVLASSGVAGELKITPEPQAKQIKLENKWDKTFKLAQNVAHQKVRFINRFGITLAGDLYYPKNIKDGAKLPAIAISGPFGAVKEQSSGLYANELASRGFITLAFDPSYTGESDGAGGVRNVASPDINTEDFSAAVDFLALQSFVDSEKIGILGICGFGGFALNAAALDTRIKAVVTSTMYDMTRVSAYGYNDTMGKNERDELKATLNAKRLGDLQSADFERAPGLPDKLSGDEPKFVADYWAYYKTPRGFHTRSINSNDGWHATSSLTLMNNKLLAFIDEMSQAALVIHGANAHSLYFSKDAYAKLKGQNKELLIVPNANHTDLYDQKDKIPFDKIESFYKANLK